MDLAADAQDSRTAPERWPTAPRLLLLAERMTPWLGAAAALLTFCALAIGLFVASGDGQRGEAYRIIFMHVPAAWMSLLLYCAMAVCAALALAHNARLPVLMMAAVAPTGGMFTFVALWTGSLWASATRGVPWVWETRLICELVLFVLYISVLALRAAAAADPTRGDRACAVLVLVGFLNLPIIYLSLRWWDTLHQSGAAGLIGSASVARTMFAGMLVMALAFGTYAIAIVLVRVRCLLLEQNAQWRPACKEAT